MFSRRHPYLFTLLILSSVCAVMFLSAVFLFLGGSSFDDAYEVVGSDTGERVAVVEIIGIIAESKDTIRTLKKFREDDSIKAIVLRVDSPGGGIGPSQEIYREIVRTLPVKKVVCSMGAVAASGGYYIAAGTSGIVANPGTITGSIGVIIGYTNFEDLLTKIGLYPVVVKSGAFKDIGSPTREMTEAERKMLQTVVDGLHAQFVNDVSNGRKLEKEAVAKIADGRILSGLEAKQLGLVDRLGNQEDAIAWAGELAGIKGEITVVYEKEERLSPLKFLLESTLQNVLEGFLEQYFTTGYIAAPVSR